MHPHFLWAHLELLLVSTTIAIGAKVLVTGECAAKPLLMVSAVPCLFLRRESSLRADALHCRGTY